MPVPAPLPISGVDEVKPPRARDANKPEPKGGYYSYIEGSEPKRFTSDDVQGHEKAWLSGIDSRLGTRATDQNGQPLSGTDFSGNPYDVYLRPGAQGQPGQEIHVIPGPNDFSYRYVLPGENPKTADDYHTEYYPGGKDLQDTVDELSKDNRDPWTNKPFVDNKGNTIHPETATIGQLKEILNRKSSFTNTKDSTGLTEDVIGANDVNNQGQAVADLLKRIDPKELTASAQAFLGFAGKAIPDDASLARMGVTKQQAQDYFKLQGAIENLQNEGANVAGIKVGGSNLAGHVGEGLNTLGLGATALKGVADFSNAVVNNAIDFSKLRGNLPAFLAQNRKDIYERTAALKGLGYRLPAQVTNIANASAYANEDSGVGRNANPAEDAPTIEGTESGVSPRLSDVEAYATPGAGLASFIPGVRQAEERVSALGAPLRQSIANLPGIGPLYSAITGVNPRPPTPAAGTPLFDKPPHPAPIASPTPAAKTAPKAQVPAKKTASTDQSDQGEQLAELAENQAPEDVSSNVEVGAPAGAGEIPRLTEQAHVDALQPGSPFYWQDHPNAYAKV